MEILDLEKKWKNSFDINSRLDTTEEKKNQ